MKKTRLIATTIPLLLLLAASSYGMLAQAKPNRLKPGIDFSGPHFNLNVHGVPDGVDKFKNDSVGPGRHSVFVPLDTSTTGNFSITFAVKGEEWRVKDGDATMDGTISIILPTYIWINSSTNGGWVLEKKTVDHYKVYVVGLGKPVDHNITLYPQAQFDNVTNKVYYSWGEFEVIGHKNGKMNGKGGGQPYWQNATDLFFCTVELWNGTAFVLYENEWVFNIPLDSYWWEVKNDGVRHMQVRFYPVFKGNGNSH